MAQQLPDADDDTPQFCGNLPYREGTDPAFEQQAAATFSATKTADGTLSLVGPCPRCHSGMNVVVPPELFLASRTGLLRRLLRRSDHATFAAGAGEQKVPVVCLCSVTHPGTPPDRRGCGAYWNLIVDDQP
ncbi:hypothetical protein [Microbispora amethystogenes]|uniref:Uncharacterized protein n=1 Tax=Microbispora amethystogenes TaxID=1427754 RepID=A0ABQ4FEJ1_9ACTN|nr:hypothetical protein [Microbispora amethystogenes]GIH33244.1 hypothetical protein Mam01_34080 [Microbispora amethystogenes]